MITEFSLFLFTLLGGVAAGAYALAWAFPGGAGESKKSWLLPVVSLVFLAIGGVALMLHLGHPERMLNAFSNPSAGITREGFATGLFGVLAVVDLILAFKGGANKAVRILAAIAGVVLLIAMGFAYVVFHGVPAWANWATVPLFVVGGLSAGACLLPVFDVEIARSGTFAICTAVLNALFACTAVAVGAHFASVGFSIVPFVVAAVVAIAAAAVAWMGQKREGATFAIAAFALAFVAVAIARYAFYMAF